MKIVSLTLALAALLLCLGGMTACGDTIDGGDTTNEVTTDGGSTVTAPTRYDYFAADVSADVDLSATDYANMQLTLPAALKVSTEDVKDYINQVRWKDISLKGLEKDEDKVTDQPLDWDDAAYIYFKGTVNGEAFKNGSNWEASKPYGLGLGSGAFVDGFEEALIGVIPSETSKENPIAITVTFPEDYTTDLAGKEAVFYVAVEYAVQDVPPTYDRAYVEGTLGYEGARDFYASDAAFLAEYEEYLLTYLETAIESKEENAKIDAIWQHLVDTAVCKNLSAAEISYYYDGYFSEIAYNYDYYATYDSTFKAQYPTLDAYAVEYTGVGSTGDWKAELTRQSTDMVKKDMIVHAIAEQIHLETVTDEEYAEKIAWLEDYYQGYMTAEMLESTMGKQTIMESALSDKVLDWLMEHATFIYKE